jgi:hypothetical protein
MCVLAEAQRLKPAARKQTTGQAVNISAVSSEAAMLEDGTDGLSRSQPKVGMGLGLHGQLKNPKRYRGPLVGLEIEAWASWLVTGADEEEDEASARTIRLVARHLRDMTGLPFRAIVDLDRASPTPTERLPTSSPSNPIWAVRSDYSLDPLAAPDGLHGVGVEVITPPLEPTLADQAGRLLAERMLADDDFMPGMAAVFMSTCPFLV